MAPLATTTTARPSGAGPLPMRLANLRIEARFCVPAATVWNPSGATPSTVYILCDTKPHASPRSGLSKGDITGIVIGITLIFLALLVWIFLARYGRAYNDGWSDGRHWKPITEVTAGTGVTVTTGGVCGGRGNSRGPPPGDDPPPPPPTPNPGEEEAERGNHPPNEDPNRSTVPSPERDHDAEEAKGQIRLVIVPGPNPVPRRTRNANGELVPDASTEEWQRAFDQSARVQREREGGGNSRWA